MGLFLSEFILYFLSSFLAPPLQKKCCELGHLSCRIFKRLICKYNKDNGKNANVKRR